MSNVWSTLSKFDVSAEVKQKGKFDYLSWAWAWAYVKEKYPTASFEKHIFRDNQDNPLPFAHYLFTKRLCKKVLDLNIPVILSFWQLCVGSNSLS